MPPFGIARSHPLLAKYSSYTSLLEARYLIGKMCVFSRLGQAHLFSRPVAASFLLSCVIELWAVPSPTGLVDSRIMYLIKGLSAVHVYSRLSCLSTLLLAFHPVLHIVAPPANPGLEAARCQTRPP